MTHTIEVSDETFAKIKDTLTQDERCDIGCYDDLVGKTWFFRAVTYHVVGRVVARFGNFIKLEDAAWIADSGRFMDALKTGVLLEVEPTGIHFLNLTSVVDFFPWKHALPKEQK